MKPELPNKWMKIIHHFQLWKIALNNAEIKKCVSMATLVILRTQVLHKISPILFLSDSLGQFGDTGVFQVPPPAFPFPFLANLNVICSIYIRWPYPSPDISPNTHFCAAASFPCSYRYLFIYLFILFSYMSITFQIHTQSVQRQNRRRFDGI